MVKITASDAAAEDKFGVSVSLSGESAVVGASSRGETGAIYVFGRDDGGADNWGEVAIRTAADGAADDVFGRPVAVDEDTVVVGAAGNDHAGSFSGAAYVFYRNQGGAENWGQVVKLAAGDAAEGDVFGTSVAVSGDIAVVGAFWDDDVARNSGSAYVFYRNRGGPDSWGQVAKLTASDPAEDGYFGDSVAVSGNVVVVGAASDYMDVGHGPGSVYVFYRNRGGLDRWGQVAKLTASQTAENCFGESLSFSGDTLIVGAGGDDDEGDCFGRAYVFRRDEGGPDNWGQVAKLVAADPVESANFGQSVSISGDVVVVGASHDDDAGFKSGSAYVFRRNEGGPDSWGQVAKLTAPDAARLDSFGHAVWVSGDLAIIGALFDDHAGDASGAAYIFDITPEVLGSAAD